MYLVLLGLGISNEHYLCEISNSLAQTAQNNNGNIMTWHYIS